jgi:peptide deformylase
LPVFTPQKMRYGGGMTIKPLIILPDPLLRQVSTPIGTVDADVLKLADDMLETMYDAPGIGLAAIQIGIAKRMLVIDVSREDEEKNPQVIINPEIVKFSDEGSVYEEGCLSIPEYYAEVERPAIVNVKYVGRDGKEHMMEADGLLATCLQHEIDHLNGVLFIDHISRLKREMVIKKFTKAAKGKAI